MVLTIILVPNYSFATKSNTELDLLQNPKEKNLKVIIENKRIVIGFQYTDTEDMWVEFKEGGVNFIFGIGNFYTRKHTKNLDMQELELFKETYTDWLSPYIVGANNSIDTNYQTFTGGWHGYNGDGTGSPTARTDNLRILVDGKETSTSIKANANKVELIVTNYIQGYNTKKEDGTGREILKEIVTYKITQSSIHVDVRIVALEDLVIKRYYGLQTDNFAWNGSIKYESSEIVNANIKSATHTKNKEDLLSKYTLVSENGKHILNASIDRENGIGNSEYLADNKPYIFTESYGKTYFNLINGIDKELLESQEIAWAGCYTLKTKEEGSN